METLEDILLEFEKEKDRYCASFDSETGKVISVGPAVSFKNVQHKIDLDKETAEEILTSKIQISNCFVDLKSGNLEIVELRTIVKIDDVLHRIPLDNYYNSIDADLFVTCNVLRKQIKFELSKNVGGTRKVKNSIKRKIHWADDTALHFYLTKYNDPHWIYEDFSFNLSELYGKKKIYENIDIPENFSIFTRRILKNYVVEIK